MSAIYPKINDRSFDLLKAIANNTAELTDGGGTFLTQAEGNARYLQLTGGTITGELKIDVASTADGLWNVGKTRLDGLVGIGVAPQANISLTIAATITPAVDTVYGLYGASTGAAAATTAIYQFYTNPRTSAAAYTLGTLCHYRAGFPNIGAGSSITTQEGFAAGSGLVGATNNYGFRGMLAAASGRWNLYMDGTAPNYLAGALTVGGATTFGTTTDATAVVNVSRNYTSGVNSGIAAQSVVQSDITASAYGYYAGLTTANSAFTLTVMRQYAAFLLSKGAASTLTTNVGFYVGAASANSGTNRYAFQGEIAGGTSTHYNLYMNGTASNYLAGSTGIMIDASTTTALNLAASTTGVSSLRVAHGAAPSSPVNGDIWTTTAGLYVRINGVTVGPLS